MLLHVGKKSYKEVTRELHGLERPWAPAGLPGGWRDSGESSQTTGGPLKSTAGPQTHRSASRRWIRGSNQFMVNRKLWLAKMFFLNSKFRVSHMSGFRSARLLAVPRWLLTRLLSANAPLGASERTTGCQGALPRVPPATRQASGCPGPL